MSQDGPIDAKYGAMKTFGYRREGLEEVNVPVGLLCAWCDEHVAPEDKGVVLLHMGPDGDSFWPQHTECMHRTIFGSVAHQDKLAKDHECDGTCEDAPGLTRRQNAIAASDYFLANRQK